MLKIFKVLILSVFLAPAITSAQDLDFVAAYLVNGDTRLEPSGLALCQGKLVFVSDKHDRDVFELIIGDDGFTRSTPFLKLNDIPVPPPQEFPILTRLTRFIFELLGISGGFDWEGVACSSHGDYFLASEYYFSVLKIAADGSKSWIGDNIYKVGFDAGLFKKNNAYIEGITFQDNTNKLILAAEREPRGMLTISESGEVDTFVQAGSDLSSEGLPFDYTGLEMVEDRLFVLERNHYQVCELTNNFVAKQCFSFKQIALSDAWGYETGKYGLAEGLAIDLESIWIIVDNNGDPRRLDQNDRRSTLMKFNNPFFH